VSKVKIRLGDLRRLIEQRLSEEDEAAEPEAFKPQDDSKTETGDSLDMQVDRFLDEYEQEATTQGPTSEGKFFRDVMRHMIAEDADADLEAGEKKTVEDINVEQYANSVANLIENIENLLEIKNTILRRVMNRLTEKYDLSVKEAFEETMEQQHGLAIGKSELDIEDEFSAPPADRAGSLSTDSAAGGGGGV